MVDTVTPNFKGLQAQGVVIVNPMSHVKYDKFSDLSSNLSGRRLDGLQSWTSTGAFLEGSVETWYPILVDGKPTGDWQDVQTMIERVKLGAMANIDRTPYPMLEDLAEIGSTFKLLQSPMGEIKQLARNFEKAAQAATHRKVVGSRDYLDAVSKTWLSGRFAFGNILLSAMRLAEGIENFTPRQTRQVARFKEAVNYDRSWRNKYGDSRIQLYENVTYREARNFRAGIYYDISNPITTLPAAFGLRNKDVLPTIWAVMPGSWFLDRLVSVDKYIKAFQNLNDPGIRVLGGYITDYGSSSELKWVYGSDITDSNKVPSQGYTWAGRTDTAVRNYQWKHRYPWSPSVADVVSPSAAMVRGVSVPESVSSVADMASYAFRKLNKFIPYFHFSGRHPNVII